MKLCKVIGYATASIKSERLGSHKLVVLKNIDDDGHPTGDSFLAVDMFGAGVSEIVAVTTGCTAAHALNETQLPVDAAVVGIIDNISIDKKVVFKR